MNMYGTNYFVYWVTLDHTCLEEVGIKDGCKLYLASKTRTKSAGKKNVDQQKTSESVTAVGSTGPASQCTDVKYGKGGHFHSLLLKFLGNHFTEEDSLKLADDVFEVRTCVHVCMCMYVYMCACVHVYACV